jgi:hypothetical protein
MANNLDSNSNYLYQMLMNQPENEPIEVDFPAEVFGYQGTIHLCVEDVVELFKNEMLNVSILQLFQHVSFLNLMFNYFKIYNNCDNINAYFCQIGAKPLKSRDVILFVHINAQVQSSKAIS